MVVLVFSHADPNVFCWGFYQVSSSPCVSIISPANVKNYTQLVFIVDICLKFGDGDGPNLCRVKKVDVSSTFIENIFRSRLWVDEEVCPVNTADCNSSLIL